MQNRLPYAKVTHRKIHFKDFSSNSRPEPRSAIKSVCYILSKISQASSNTEITDASILDMSVNNIYN